MPVVQVRMSEGSDIRVFYDDTKPDGTITRTLAMRYANGGVFEGEIFGNRRILIEESK